MPRVLFTKPVKYKLGLVTLKMHHFRRNTFAKLIGYIKKRLVMSVLHGYTKGENYLFDDEKEGNTTSLTVHIISVAKASE